MSTSDAGGRTEIISSVSVEVARRQPDGTWLRVIDQPNVLG